MRRRPKGCPGCGHGKNRHVGFQCYGPLQLIPFFGPPIPLYGHGERGFGRPVLLQAVGGCSCHWAYWDNREFRGWKPPEGVTSRRMGHYRAGRKPTQGVR